MRALRRPARLLAVTFAAVVALTACTAESTGVPGVAGGDSATPHCDALTGARRTVDYHLSLLLTLDDPAAFDEVTGADAPFRLDPGAFRTAVEALSALSGAEGELDRLRRIGRLLEERAGVEDPFASDSDSGQQLADLANSAFGEVRVGLDTALEAMGCRVR